jgi:RimJ/RimL family protein N-acetyltransferase/N-acetylglutamate synthase-like GNAT family acetyltransferase
LRVAKPEDIAALTALVLRAKAHWPYSVAQIEAWRDQLAVSPESLSMLVGGATTTYVAQNERGIAGFYQLRCQSGECALEHLWVEPAQMRQGIGGTLLSHARVIAMDRGAARICIDSEPHAEAFYVAHGAVRVSTIAAPIPGDPLRYRPQLEIALRGDAAPVAMRGLATSRLRLHPQTVTHADEMFAVLSDAAIYEFENTPPESIDWLHARFARLESRRSADGAQHWLNWVIAQGDGTLMGFVQATVYQEGRAAIAYVLASTHWGHGYATEAVNAMIGELSERYHVLTLTAVLKRANHRSLKMLTRLGFAAATPARAQEIGIEADEILMERGIEGR